MIRIEIPGRGHLEIKSLVLDLNGTIALDGGLLSGVPERIRALSRGLDICVITADTFGKAGALFEGLPVKLIKISAGKDEALQKRRVVASLGATSTVAIGNGANDVLMLEAAAIGIAVLGPEGTSTAALTRADILLPGAKEALDLLSHPKRLLATLRR